MTPLAVTVAETSRLIPFRHTKLHAMIKSGELESVRVGGRRMILMRSIQKLLKLEAANDPESLAEGQE